MAHLTWALSEGGGEGTRTLGLYIANVWFSAFGPGTFRGLSSKRRFDPPSFPHDPSHSLSIRSSKVTPERSWGVTTDRYSRPIGRRLQCPANGTRSTWATITFLGETTGHC
jgi:hypothetical protein